MADFCKKCADELGFEADLTIITLDIPKDHVMWDLCEGCGRIAIANEGGVEVVYRADVCAKEIKSFHDTFLLEV